MQNYYDFYEQNDIAKEGSKDVEKYLRTNPEILMVKNVEEDPFYQEIDVDILCAKKEDDGVVEKKIEVKVDTYFDKSKNYFFELISNKQKDSNGCLLVTQSDYLFYYFLKKELHIFKTDELQYWLINNKNRFKQKEVKNKNYVSMGIIVPRDTFKRECQVWVVDMKQYI